MHRGHHGRRLRPREYVALLSPLAIVVLLALGLFGIAGTVTSPKASGAPLPITLYQFVPDGQPTGSLQSNEYAQSFTTGSTPVLLNSLGVFLKGGGSGNWNVTFSVEGSTPTQTPDPSNVLWTTTVQPSPAYYDNANLPGSISPAISLAPNTTYFVVVDGTSSPNSDINAVWYNNFNTPLATIQTDVSPTPTFSMLTSSNGGSAWSTYTPCGTPGCFSGGLEMSISGTTPAVPTLSNFSNVAVNLGSPSQAIAPPTSSAPGTFTYSSSNPAVASVSGSTLSFNATGTATITATFTPTDPTSYTTATTTMTVTVAPVPVPPGPPPVPPPTPVPATTTTVPTTLTVTASPSPVAVGMPVTFTAAGSQFTKGAISFSDNGSSMACSSSTPWNGTTARCTTSYASTGTHDVQATLEGSGQPSSPRASTTLTVVQPGVNVKLDFGVGTRAAGAKVTVGGQNLQPGTTASITLHSTPTQLGTATVGPSGSVASTVTLPNDVAPGVHHIDVTGTGQAGVGTVSQSWYFSVGASGKVTNVAAGPSASPPSWSAASINGTKYPPYSITRHAHDIVKGTQVSFYTVTLALGGAGAAGIAAQRLFNGGDAAAGAGAAGSSVRSRRRDERKKKSGSVSSAKVKNLKSKHEGEAWGDASGTWRWPGVARSDALSLELPVRVATTSPLLARVLNDGAYLRAMVGPFAWLAPLVGFVFGILAAISSHGTAIPPCFAMILIIVVVGTFDASAGFAASFVFFLGILFAGGIDSAEALRTMLGMTIMFFAVPLTASATRPLRRAPSADLGAHFDRAADVLIAGLLAAWGIEKIIGALPALSGQAFPIASDATVIALCALGAVAVRYGIETTASHLYPGRLASTAPAKIPFSNPPQRLASTALKTAIFVFVAYAYVGNVWELWVGAFLFIAPAILAIYENSLPNFPKVASVIPKGVVKVVVMLVVSKLAADALANAIGDPAKLISLGFVYLAIPGVILSVIGNFGRDGKEWGINWPYRVLGTIVVALGILLVLGVLSIP